jgi:hypothetical protein
LIVCKKLYKFKYKTYRTSKSNDIKLSDDAKKEVMKYVEQHVNRILTRDSVEFSIKGNKIKIKVK